MIWTTSRSCCKKIMVEHGRIIFNSDGYSKRGTKEAEEERGLANLRTSVDAIPEFGSEEAVALFNNTASSPA
ncbi:MAG: hypothetical protein R3D55_25425 [Chloroflexota bacterium]